MKKYLYNEKPFNTASVSIISSELTKEYKPEFVNRSNNHIESDAKKLKCGTVSFSEMHEGIDKYSELPDSEILNQFGNIKLSRVEFQIYLAIFDLFITSYNKTKDFEKPVLISLKDFHNKVLGNKNRIRKSDIEKYVNIFERLSNKFVRIDTTTSIYKKARKVLICSSIANVTIVSIPEFNFDFIKIFPTGYIQYEISNVKHISNYLPKNFIQLDLRENDNVLFFGYYLTRMHKINKDESDNSFWECTLNKIVNNALPDNGAHIFKRYKTDKRKSEYIRREVYEPLQKALEIIQEKVYITNYDLDPFSRSDPFLQKLKLNFNYDKSKMR